MPVYVYLPENQNQAYLVVSKSSSPFGFQTFSSNLTYIFSIDRYTGSIYSSSTQNVDVFSSLNDAKNFLSVNFKDEKMKNLDKLGEFLLGASITDSKLLISVVEEYEKVASISNNDIYRISKIKSCYMQLQSSNQFSTSQIVDPHFYFSPSLDLSSTFPYYYINQLNLNNNLFAFNRSFLTGFIENKLLLACVIVIKGLICSENKNIIYITKFCNSSNDSENISLNPDKLECECELIYKKSIRANPNGNPQSFYISHAWRRGPSLCFNERLKKKLSETKRYIWKEIRSRFNIDKIHFLSLNNLDDELIKPENDLKTYFGIEELTIKSISEELPINNISEEQRDQIISKISDSISIPKEDHGNSLFTVLNSDGEIICIQDFIYRFMSSDSLQMTDMLTCAFLLKIAKLMLQSNETKEIDYLIKSTFDMGELLSDFNIVQAKGSQSGLFSFFNKSVKKDPYTEYFSMYSSTDTKENRKFQLDPQHTNYYCKITNNQCSLLYVFPEPFIIDKLHFLVYPQKEQKSDKEKKYFDLYIRCLPTSNSVIQLIIPYVYKKTWLHYDFRYIMKKSLQSPYDSDFLCPVSSIYFEFKLPSGKLENSLLKDLRIGVKRATKSIFKYIVPTSQKSFFKINDSGVDFDGKQRSLEDLININKYRIEKHYDCSRKNNMISPKNNPWFYDLKSQLLSKEKYDCCPFCNKNIRNGFSAVKIIDKIDPIIISPLDDVDNKENCIRICSNCASEIESMIAFYEEKRSNFIFVDNSNSIFFLMQKYHSPSYFYSKPDDQINLSKLSLFSDQDFTLNKCLFKNTNSIFSSNKIYDLYFFSPVNINKIKIELNENTKIESGFQINIKFNHSKENIIEKTAESSFIYEKTFSDIEKEVLSISIEFTTQNKKALINVKKIDLIGSLPKSLFNHPRFESKEIDNGNKIIIKPSFIKSRRLPDNRIQEFKVSYSILYGIYLKSTDEKLHPKSLIININKLELTNLILPKIKKDDIFYFAFNSPISNVSDVSILYLDSVPKIEKFEVSFNGE